MNCIKPTFQYLSASTLQYTTALISNYIVSKVGIVDSPRANGAERRSGRKPGAGVLIPPGYLYPGKGTRKRSLKFIKDRGRMVHCSWLVILTDLKICSGLSWIVNTDWSNLKFALWRLHDGSEITSISFKLYFCKIFVNFKTFLRAKEHIKELSKVADVNEVCVNIDVLFVLWLL
jgi:hypothetical protein